MVSSRQGESVYAVWYISSTLKCKEMWKGLLILQVIDKYLPESGEKSQNEVTLTNATRQSLIKLRGISGIYTAQCLLSIYQDKIIPGTQTPNGYAGTSGWVLSLAWANNKLKNRDISDRRHHNCERNDVSYVRTKGNHVMWHTHQLCGVTAQNVSCKFHCVETLKSTEGQSTKLLAWSHQC